MKQMIHRVQAALMAGLLCLLAATPALAEDRAAMVHHNWYRLVLELVRHTATYSPPVASRAFGYLGVIGYESIASGRPDMATLAGQVNDLPPLPPRETGAVYDEAAVLQGALSFAIQTYFGNTGPTGQRAMAAMDKQQTATVSAGIAPDVLARSLAYGQSIGQHVLAWSQTDGGAVVENMGFPYEYALTEGPAHWVPTSLIRQQQMPLLPKWGENRPFAMPTGAACPLPAPPAYSEDPTSEFYAQAMEVAETRKTLTDEQKIIARFWSDDPMLSPTPPGHWVSITMDILERDGADVATRVDIQARLGMALADAFIGCWQAKFEHDLLRPVTYIRRVIDPKWEPLLITPPFPEYPSGHSTQSGAAAAVLTAFFGENFAFDDDTHEDDGLGIRHFPDFNTAAAEAAVSRLYGGIHFRAANENGLEQGRCIGAHTVALKTRG